MYGCIVVLLMVVLFLKPLAIQQYPPQYQPLFINKIQNKRPKLNLVIKKQFNE